VHISVANPGEPIDPAVLSHLFDRFYRVEASRTNSRENHGLGLAIVKAVAEMHGGTVFAASAGGINTFGFSVAAGSAEPREPEREKREIAVPRAAPSAPVELAATASNVRSLGARSGR